MHTTITHKEDYTLPDGRRVVIFGNDQHCQANIGKYPDNVEFLPKNRIDSIPKVNAVCDHQD